MTSIDTTIINSDSIIDCPVCLDSFEELGEKTVICGCGHKVCLPCAKQTLLYSSKDPHCMNCNRGWDRTFQYQYFGNKWINNEYKKHRSNLLLEREKARLPDTQPIVVEYLKINDYQDEINELLKQEEKIVETLNKIREQRISISLKIDKIKRGDISQESKNKKTFIQKCPNDDCRGFLSTAYKCELCKVFVCSKCHEIKGENKNVEHVCNNDTVETVKLLKKDTKPCPSCATPIFKINGCDQMWCTQCNVAFSWKNGTIETGVVHNPHYYQWMQKNGMGNIQNPGAIVCGGIPEYYIFNNNVMSFDGKIILDKKRINELKMYTNQNIRQYNTNIIYNIMVDWHMSIVHNSYIVIQPLRQDLNGVINNQDLRIKFLLNKIDEKHFSKIITQRDNTRQKKIAMLQIFELFHTVCIEFLNTYNNQFSLETTEECIAFSNMLYNAIKYVQETRRYCNNELEKIAKNYKMKVYYIKPDCKSSDYMQSASQMNNLIMINQ